MVDILCHSGPLALLWPGLSRGDKGNVVRLGVGYGGLVSHEVQDVLLPPPSVGQGLGLKVGVLRSPGLAVLGSAKAGVLRRLQQANAQTLTSQLDAWMSGCKLCP